MDKDKLKKIITGLIAGGVLTGGGFTVTDKLNCEVEINREGEKICFTMEEINALQENLNTPVWGTIQTWEEL